MNIEEIFASKYLKADDLKGREVQVRISQVELQTMQDGKVKPCIFFMGKEKGVLLNKTNSFTIADTYGTDTDNWIGKDIVLFATRVMDPAGKMVPAIRLRVPQQAKPVQAGSGHPNAPTDGDEDFVPF